MAKKKPETITFEYKMSPNFAVYAVCGELGGLNSPGEIIMTLYNEKAAITERKTYRINDDGPLFPNKKTKEKYSPKTLKRHFEKYFGKITVRLDNYFINSFFFIVRLD